MYYIKPADHIDESDTEVDFIDVISIDMFNVVIPVFIDANQMLHALDKVCVDVDTSEAAFHFDGMACLYKDAEGAPVFAVYLHTESTVDVWVHEASHLVDMILETMGIPAGFESTETRAYMLQYIFKCMSKIMHIYKSELSSQSNIAVLH